MSGVKVSGKGYAVNGILRMYKMHDVHGVTNLTRQDLELAVAIGEKGWVTRGRLPRQLSRSGARQQLRSLEERVGGRLFERGRQRMTATPLGEELAGRGRRICAEFRNSEEVLSRFVQGKKRIVRLGTECYTSYQWLPAVVRRLER